jgi:N-acetylglucosaminylphosphatidylinositol deacetylase
MNNDWPIEKLKEHIVKKIQEKNIEGIITFDNYGVSGHINHRAVSKAC